MEESYSLCHRTLIPTACQKKRPGSVVLALALHQTKAANPNTDAPLTNSHSFQKYTRIEPLPILFAICYFYCFDLICRLFHLL